MVSGFTSVVSEAMDLESGVWGRNRLGVGG
jgi:hypothetical protein